MAKLKLSSLVVAAALAIAPNMGSAAVIGFLGNFDVINDTGKTAHGFEIELEGLHSSDITDTFGGTGRWFPSGRGFDPATSVERYGAPTITEYSNGAIFGTKVTYLGLFDAATSSWDYGTPSGNFVTPGDNCWTRGGVGYSAATPCDHFGVGTRTNATKTTYSWLLETGTVGVLTNGVVSLPAPKWAVIPAVVQPGLPPAPPVVIAQIQAPEPIPALEIEPLEPQFGEAIWVKVFTTELENEVELEDLIGGNAVINLAKTKTETEWQLLQTDPGNPLAGQLESGYGAPVGPNAASIIRRYEFYKYAGEYDLADHQAILITSDSHPELNEIGTYIGAQNVANNLAVAAVPEPETYAMLLVGVGLIGLRLRSRKQAKTIG
ncbi:MAG: PEP-CTERM sorting domain-containing protein [Pseudomonadota bacterium]|nr:PEP-CTERM sorting domain-containing protein [Pseudomonadota bacterium]